MFPKMDMVFGTRKKQPGWFLPLPAYTGLGLPVTTLSSSGNPRLVWNWGEEGAPMAKESLACCTSTGNGEASKTAIPTHYFMSFFSKLLMKSLASSEISSNASSSKSQVVEVTLAKVSLSLSPMKGESPLTLGKKSRKTIMKGRAARREGGL